MQTEPSTALMLQYHALKQQVPNALLMVRLGDFYELFYDDAVTAASELEITLTSRSKEKGQAIPMCGVPHHSSEGYIARLIQRGFRVAVCEQVEDPRFTKKLVRREIALKQFADIDTFVAEGAKMKSGEIVPADLIVLATGYRPQEELVQKLFGADVTNRVGTIWGFGETQELRNVYVRTGQSGLWFIAGGLAQCRIGSKQLALQIKAIEEGLLK